VSSKDHPQQHDDQNQGDNIAAETHPPPAPAISIVSGRPEDQQNDDDDEQHGDLQNTSLGLIFNPRFESQLYAQSFCFREIAERSGREATIPALRGERLH
jgi:hypothetical protein